MALIRLQISDAIVFQLLRRDLAATNPQAGKWKEVNVVYLAVKPATLLYSYGSRSVTTQTTPDSGFVDKYGSRLTRVMMQGTFGLQPRRQGATMQDGYTRLLNFREMFRLSQQARRDRTKDGLQQQYVYAVNFFDFVNSEMMAVNLDTFDIRTDARVNPFIPTYTLSFSSVGPIIAVVSKDPMLFMLQGIESLISAASDALDQLLQNDAVQAALLGVNAVVDGIEILGGLKTNLGITATLYSQALSGVPNSVTESVQAAGMPLVMIKG